MSHPPSHQQRARILPREVIAEEAELHDIAARSTAPSTATAPSRGAGHGR